MVLRNFLVKWRAYFLTKKITLKNKPTVIKTVGLKNRVAIMGGSFNPFHLGHENSLKTVQKKFAIDQTILVPAYQVPLKEEDTSVSASQRLEMLNKVFIEKKSYLIDKQELNRKGMSYSYRTVTQMEKKYKNSDLFFIIGLDQFEIFDQWKNFFSILKKVNLIVTSRSPNKFPKTISECPQELNPFLKKKNLNKISLKGSDKIIYFVQLKDIDISSSLVRKKVREKKSITNLVPTPVASYIKEHNLYCESKQEDEQDLKKISAFCIQELEDRKAFDVKAFDLSKHPTPFELGIVASGSNTMQVRSLAQHLKRQMREVLGLKPLSEEGEIESNWIVQDYGDIVIHIFYDYARSLYRLEDLWSQKTSRD